MARFLCGALALAAAGLVGCDAGGRDASIPITSELRGAVVIEPPRLTVGEVARVEVTVVTPPEHWVRPVHPPGEIPGFWLLDAEPLAIQRDPSRWVHRTRIRARARAPGRFEWPATTVEIETPERGVVSLELEERPLEVASVTRDFPDRTSPFPLRPAPETPRERGALLPFLAGGLVTVLCLALLAMARRARAPGARAAPAAREPARLPAWRSAQATLESALSLTEQDPERAADAASAGLRHFFAVRFSAPIQSLTTQELRELAAPVGTERHWPVLLSILEQLDAARFQPRVEGEASGVREAIARAQQLVTEATPEARWQ
jgi:hypothetical protein